MGAEPTRGRVYFWPGRGKETGRRASSPIRVLFPIRPFSPGDHPSPGPTGSQTRALLPSQGDLAGSTALPVGQGSRCAGTDTPRSKARCHLSCCVTHWPFTRVSAPSPTTPCLYLPGPLPASPYQDVPASPGLTSNPTSSRQAPCRHLPVRMVPPSSGLWAQSVALGPCFRVVYSGHTS